MKILKSIAMLSALFALASFTGCNKKTSSESGKTEKSKSVKIGIAKIVQHVALDSVEQGVIDVLKENNVEAEFDLQNANGDANTAAQIAMKYRDEKVDVAVGIATPIALALANTLDEIPIVFGTVTDPLGSGLVTSLDHGEKNVTGMSDAIPTEQHIALFK
jgi:putative ABC transport system substrate-binding protein